MIKLFKDIALVNSEKRKLHKLASFISDDVYSLVANKILKLKKGNVFIVTGFFCFGAHETDGPLGSIFLSLALKRLGHNPIILTESYSKNIYEKYDIDVIYIDENKPTNYYKNIIKEYSPSALISIERAGRDENGKYNNMRKIDISANTNNLDEIFLIENNCYTLGIGDGGNEIGMGLLKKYIDGNFGIIPSVVKTDDLIIATVSNWGAYSLVGMLEYYTEKNLLPEYDEVKNALKHLNDLGLVDGVTGQKGTVDSYSIEVDRDILNNIKKSITKSKNCLDVTKEVIIE